MRTRCAFVALLLLIAPAVGLCSDCVWIGCDEQDKAAIEVAGHESSRRAPAAAEAGHCDGAKTADNESPVATTSRSETPPILSDDCCVLGAALVTAEQATRSAVTSLGDQLNLSTVFLPVMAAMAPIAVDQPEMAGQGPPLYRLHAALLL